MTPLERGSLLHSLFERFFSEWQRLGHAAITPALMSEALALFGRLADEALAALPVADRALERTRLLGSIVGMGVAERVFELEADSGVQVAERRLETALNGVFVFPRGFETRRIAVRGKADRIDVLADGSLAVVDYKLGRMPDLRTSVQIAVYAHCARQALETADGRDHPIASATYLAFGDDRRLEGPLSTGQDPAQIAVEARASEFAAAVDRIEAGEFPPRPKRPNECQWCGYAGVCRKEYRAEVEDAAESV
jgi:RecB family exonuclease